MIGKVLDDFSIKTRIEKRIKELENTDRREQKEFLAYRIASMVKDGQTIGFGSGSTSFIAVEKIAELVKKNNFDIKAVPSSNEIKELCNYFEIETISLNDAKIDWAFDGADEIDSKNNLIKGKGKCMFKEKLNFLNSPKVYILADESKYVANLGQDTAIPVECYTGAIEYVKQELTKLGATQFELVKDSTGNLAITDLGNCIITAKFDSSDINKELENNMKLITGVIETGLFYGYKNVEVL